MNPTGDRLVAYWTSARPVNSLQFQTEFVLTKYLCHDKISESSKDGKV